MSKIKALISRLIKPKSIEIYIGILCTAFFLIINFFPIPVISTFINQLDGRIYDNIVKLDWNPLSPVTRVVIIDIDNESIEQEGRWPWPRDKMGLLIQKLKEYGVVSIGMDIVMSEPELNYAQGLINKLNKDSKYQPLIQDLKKVKPLTDNDKEFAKSLLDHNVVLGYLFHHEKDIQNGALPQPIQLQFNEPMSLEKLPFTDFIGYNGSLDLFVNASGEAGFVTNTPDSDGTVRHTLLIAKNQGKFYPSLALKTAMNYLLMDHIKILTTNQKVEGIELDGNIIPTNSRGQLLIPFWGQAGTLDYYSAADVLNNKVDAKDLEGTIAIIGSTMTLLADLHQTPVAQLFPGVEIVGNIVQGIVDQLLADEFEWNTLEGVLILLLIGLCFAFIVPFVNVTSKFVIMVITILAIFCTSFYMLVYEELYIPCSTLIIMITIQTILDYSYAYLQERRQKKQISQLFGQYVPQDYVKELIDAPDQYSMEGQTRNMTALFADIRGFTSLSEALDASGVKRLLNTFFTPITEMIFKHRGTIDKYVGDMIVAFWGAPMEDKEHSFNAVMTSLEIFSKIPEINNKMTENNLPKVNIGLGLATGLMNVGDMGSEFRRAYTVLGDTVNLASRLQDLTKFYQVDILTNDTTMHENPMFLWKAIDKVAVKGRKTALTIYTPLGLLTESSAQLIQEVNEYHAALEPYYSQNWQTAEPMFKQLIQNYPKIYLYKLYLERVQEFKKTPPPADWDGVYTHLHK